jgi:hypothetical protein
MSVNANARPFTNNNFWSAQNFASRAERVHQQAASEQAAQQQAQYQDFMSVVGRTLVDIVNGYTAQMRPADTNQVANDFYQAFPNTGASDFQQTLETLKREGVLYEMKSVEGFMGQRTTRLYVL